MSSLDRKIEDRDGEEKRTGRAGAFLFKLCLLLFLGAAVAANVIIRPHEAEYGLDAYPGFWAAFGLLVSMAMILLMKKVVQPLLVRPEEDDEHDV